VKKTSILAVALVAAATTPLAAKACGSEPYLGEICTFGFTFCPRGYLPADGSLVPISQNSALFSLFGTTYGGNGTTTFALPDLRGRVWVGAGNGPGLSPVSPGQQGGSEQVTLTAAQMPVHTHAAMTTATVNSTANAASANGNSTTPTGGVWAGSSARDQVYSNAAPNATLAAGAISSTANATTTVANSGSGQPIDNRAPYLGLLTCVAAQGIFPSRP
jgi:microcystin-dependent protein